MYYYILYIYICYKYRQNIRAHLLSIWTLKFDPNSNTQRNVTNKESSAHPADLDSKMELSVVSAAATSALM